MVQPNQLQPAMAVLPLGRPVVPVIAVVPEQVPVPLPAESTTENRKRNWPPKVAPELTSGSSARGTGTTGSAGLSAPNGWMEGGVFKEGVLLLWELAFQSSLLH